MIPELRALVGVFTEIFNGAVVLAFLLAFCLMEALP